MASRYSGYCTNCGKRRKLTMIDDETSLCNECIEFLDYFECDECHELWIGDAIHFMEDGRHICDRCSREMSEI